MRTTLSSLVHAHKKENQKCDMFLKTFDELMNNSVLGQLHSVYTTQVKMTLTIKWTASSMRTYFNFTIFMNCKPLDGILAMIQVKCTNKRHVWSTLTTCCNLHNKSSKLEDPLKCMKLKINKLFFHYTGPLSLLLTTLIYITYL